MELESDFINPIDMCERTNRLVLAEYITHASLVVLFLLTGHWFEVFINLPLLGYHAYRSVPKSPISTFYSYIFPDLKSKDILWIQLVYLT